MTTPELVVDGRQYTGWIRLEVEKSLDQFVDAWSVEHTDRWALGGKPWPILSGAEVQIRLKGEPLVSGHVTRNSVQLAGTDYRASAAGRSYTADLVDCAPLATSSGQLRNVTLGEAAQTICDPFFIQVDDRSGDRQKFTKLDVDLGETCFDLLDRICRSRGVLPTTTSEGNLLLVPNAPLSRFVALSPDDAYARSISHDESGRFRDYYVYGQHPGEETFRSDKVLGQSGLASDAGVSRYRPLVVLADSPSAKAALDKQAAWERNVRAGRSETITYNTFAPLAPDGAPWEPGMQVEIDDPYLRVSARVILRSVRWSWSSTGPEVILEMTRPEAYSPDPYPARGRGGNW